jgi:hypothetical protein
MSLRVPPRSPSQRMDALRVANETRFARAELRRHLGSLDRLEGREIVADILDAEQPPEFLRTIEIGNLLRYPQFMGRRAAFVVCYAAGVAMSRQLHSLTERQRSIIADELRRPAISHHARAAA